LTSTPRCVIERENFNEVKVLLTDYAFVAFFIFFGIFFVAAALIGAWFIRPQRPSRIKGDIYECGETTRGTSWVQYNVRFYVVALAFVIFDVEAAFLLPWAVAAKKLGLYAFVEIMIFVGILLVALAYAWRKGGLKWA
jgi:NADH-quinone oxidoreductase subunit A